MKFNKRKITNSSIQYPARRNADLVFITQTLVDTTDITSMAGTNEFNDAYNVPVDGFKSGMFML